jgi:uncharacterized protein (TIGR00255 family)
MIKSMTGFGRHELKSSHGPIRVEIKTVNHKFLEISSRFPGHLAEFEEPVRKMISQVLRRGKVNLFVAGPDPAVFSSRLVLNEKLALEVSHKIQRLKNILNLKAVSWRSAVDQSMLLREVLRTPDVLTRDSSSDGQAVLLRDIQKAALGALENLKKSRLLEGRALEKDLRGRISEIEKSLKVIEKRIPILSKEYKKYLESKIKEFVKDNQIDQERLTLEVALYVKNSDISEEVTRLKSHLAAMRKTLLETGEIGRKIDFLGQEMQREANTMGAKSSDMEIANRVIEIKSSIEKIREQSQNVE